MHFRICCSLLSANPRSPWAFWTAFSGEGCHLQVVGRILPVCIQGKVHTEDSQERHLRGRGCVQRPLPYGHTRGRILSTGCSAVTVSSAKEEVGMPRTLYQKRSLGLHFGHFPSWW